MTCPKCGHAMHLEDVLTHRTTSPEEEDEFTEMWVCENEKCGYSKEDYE